MSMLHQFVLIDRPLLADIGDFPRDDPSSVRIHHDLLEYIHATLDLIPVHGAWRDDGPRQIDHAGVSVIRRDGAAIAERVFRAWADLFAAGPRHIALTGDTFEQLDYDDEPASSEPAPADSHDSTPDELAGSDDSAEAPDEPPDSDDFADEPDEPPDSDDSAEAPDEPADSDDFADEPESPDLEAPEDRHDFADEPDDDDEWPHLEEPAVCKVHSTPIPVAGRTGFERFEIDRDAAVTAFRILADWSARVAAGDGVYLLHGGI